MTDRKWSLARKGRHKHNERLRERERDRQTDRRTERQTDRWSEFPKDVIKIFMILLKMNFYSIGFWIYMKIFTISFKIVKI